MPKLLIEDLIEFVKVNTLSSEYDGFLFSKKNTAKHMAEHFGVSQDTISKKLRELVEQGIIISKKAYVKGESGKRLVFAYRWPSQDEQGKHSITGDMALPIGNRDTVFKYIGIKNEAKTNGDCKSTRIYKIQNISNLDIHEITLPPIKFSYLVSKKDIMDIEVNTGLVSLLGLQDSGLKYDCEITKTDQFISLHIDGKSHHISPNAIRLVISSGPGKLSNNIKHGMEERFSEILYTIPLKTPLKSAQIIEIKLVSLFPGTFTNLLEFDYTSLVLSDIVLSAHLEITAPKGYSIHSVKRFKDTVYKNGLVVIDTITKQRKENIEDQTVVKSTKSSISIEIDKPVVNIQYILPFYLSK